jgi:hypothetical protein
MVVVGKGSVYELNEERRLLRRNCQKLSISEWRGFDERGENESCCSKEVLSVR